MFKDPNDKILLDFIESLFYVVEMHQGKQGDLKQSQDWKQDSLAPMVLKACVAILSPFIPEILLLKNWHTLLHGHCNFIMYIFLLLIYTVQLIFYP